jgi:hypothetical protein
VSLTAWLVDLVRGPACPYRCGYRGHDMAGHVDVEHCGDDHVLRGLA